MRNLKKLMAMGLVITMVSTMLMGCGSSSSDSSTETEKTQVEETETVEETADAEDSAELTVPEVAEATLTGAAVAEAAKSCTIQLDVDMNSASADLMVVYVMDVGVDMEFVVAQSEIPEDADAMKYTSCVELGKGIITAAGDQYEVTFNYDYDTTDEDGNVVATTAMTTVIPLTYADGVYTATIEAGDGTGATGIIGAFISEDCEIASGE